MVGYCMYYSLYFPTSHSEARFESQANPFRTCGAQSDAIDVFIRVLLLSARSIILRMLLAQSHSSTLYAVKL